MPAVNARPPPVSTTSRTVGAPASVWKASRRARMIPGSRRFSGGRSRVHQAAPPTRRRRTGASISVLSTTTLVAAHRRVDRLRPVVEPADEAPHALEAELAQVVGDGRAADALVAGDDGGVLGVGFVGPGLHLPRG